MKGEPAKPEDTSTPTHLFDMAVGQHQWYHFGVGPPPILVYFSGDWDVHWGYGVLTHSHIYPTTSGHRESRTKYSAISKRLSAAHKWLSPFSPIPQLMCSEQVLGTRTDVELRKRVNILGVSCVISWLPGRDILIYTSIYIYRHTYSIHT